LAGTVLAEIQLLKLFFYNGLCDGSEPGSGGFHPSIGGRKKLL
jgi:hypothetical protein